MSTYPPTPEQAAIIAAYGTGNDLVVEAGAGTGKTSTLRFLAEVTPGRRLVYLAYNRSIADEASASFPRNVLCRTAHSLAFGSVGRAFAHRMGPLAPRLPAREVARLLDINEPLRLSDDLAPLAPTQLARLAMTAVGRWCQSADPAVTADHVARVPGLEALPVHAALAREVARYAARAWEDLSDPGGRLRFDHDMYLKIWCLTNPQLPGDVVLLDEAQDSNPVIAGLVDRQRSAQRILVGDRCQAIYGWRGAQDAMAKFTGTRLSLSQSFRFGPAVATEANKWLGLLGAQLHLRGYDAINSRVGQLETADAILTRSNATAVGQALAAIEAGQRPALVGGGKDVRRLAEAALELHEGRGTSHPELMAFTSWQQVQEYVEMDDSGSDLRTFVALIDRFGAASVVRIVDNLVDEADADVVISTAHKSKGREWDRVKIANDFPEPRTAKLDREGAMLAYVAVTRAKLHLDPEGLAWVNRWVVGAQYHRDPAERLAAVAAIAPEFVVPIAELIEASSLGTPEAVALRAAAREVPLTGMAEEQAEWDGVPPPAAPPGQDRWAAELDALDDEEPDELLVMGSGQCARCGTSDCHCDPIKAAQWSELTGLPAGRATARAGYR